MSVNNIKKEFLFLKNNNIIFNNTLEILNACFIADEECIFGNIDMNYANKEHDWYLSNSLNINDMKQPIPTIWKNIADNNGFINSNYGWCVYSDSNFKQFNEVKQKLLNDEYTRQALMIYTRPSMHIDSIYNNRKDFMCTSTVQYLIRNNELISIVTMRSNDAIYGYKYDFKWQKFVQQELLNSIKHKYPLLTIGKILWNVGSLHIYKKHFDLVE